MTDVDTLIADMLVEYGINLLRFSAGVRAKVLAILAHMEAELIARLAHESLAKESKSRANATLKDTAEIIKEYYGEIEKTTNLKLVGATKATVAAVDKAISSALRIRIGINPPTANIMKTLASDALIHGAPSWSWWERQAGDTSFRFANAVRQGMANSESNGQIINRIVGVNGQTGVLDISRTSATRLVHSSVQTVTNEARMATFKENKDIVDGIQQVSTLDGHTTDICIAYSGAMWDMNYEPMGDTTLPYGGGVPRHWGCRSVMIPVLKSFKDMGIDLPEFPASTRASSGGQVPANMTMKQWLDGRTDAQLDEQLGKGRAKLYRDKVITLQQLLDQSGNPLTLAQLLVRYGA